MRIAVIGENDHVIDADSAVHTHTTASVEINVEAELAEEAPATAGHPRAAVRAAFHLLMNRLADSLVEPPDVDRLLWIASSLETQLLKPLRMFSAEEIDPTDDQHVDYLLAAIAALTKAVPGRRQGHGSAEELLGMVSYESNLDEARDAVTKALEEQGFSVLQSPRDPQTIHIAQRAAQHPRDTEPAEAEHADQAGE
jgi:hypothetical protein